MFVLIVGVLALSLGIALGYWLRSGRAEELVSAAKQDVEVGILDIRADVILALQTAENDGKAAVGTVKRYIEAHLGKAPATSAPSVPAAQEIAQQQAATSEAQTQASS